MRLALIHLMAAALTVGCLCPAAFSHDMAAMSVACTFAQDRAYNVEITLDREHLPRGMFDQGDADWIARQIADETIFEFDGVRELLPRNCITAVNLSATKIVVHLIGSAPAGAAAFSFAHSLPLGQCYLSSRKEGDEESIGQWLHVGEKSAPFMLGYTVTPRSRLEVIAMYMKLGFTHIVPFGADHILFVLGLFLLSLKSRPILAQITAFTIAHSVTLALSMYGVVKLPPRFIEPAIALSIAYVAIENLFLSEFKPWRTAIVFGFGLVHGLGFAGVLTELGLPRSQFVPALISFNCGVELGQISVVAVAFLAVGLWFGSRTWYRQRIAVPASALIALVGLYWTLERTLA